jgi:hypothetical protein
MSQEFLVKSPGDAEPSVLFVDGEMAEEHLKAVVNREQNADRTSATVGGRNEAKPAPFKKKPTDSSRRVVFSFT